MNFENLLRNKKIEEIEKENFDDASSNSDINSAENSFKAKDFAWASAIAYNAVLRVSRSLMQSLGYRAIGKEHHKNTFEFLRELRFNEDLVNYFDRIRIKRNKFLYGDVDEISEENAKEVLEGAKKFVLEIRTFVLNNRTEVKK